MHETVLQAASESLSCDLLDVSIGFGRIRDSLAFTFRNHIALECQVQRMAEAEQRTILVHELAHVAQKRRGRIGLPQALFRNPNYRMLLEIDAACATADILTGQKVRSLLPDDPEMVSHWGPAGHYWTSLTVMLSAGMGLRTSLRRAFFCQMPDQVLEFDAIAAAVDDHLPIQHIESVPVLGRRATPPEEFYNETVQLVPPINMAIPGTGGMSYNLFPGFSVSMPWEASSSSERRAMTNREISSGLHCLTGRRGADEVAFRESNSRALANNEVAFGLSLHCFGDSYSHQDASGTMYPPITGHARDGHAPDSLREHQTQYLAYVRALYSMMRDCFGGTERVSLPSLLAGLRVISGMRFDGNDEQINVTQSAVLREFCVLMGLASASDLSGYSPETERIAYWRNFHPRHTSILAPEGQANVFRATREYGRLWYTNRAH